MERSRAGSQIMFNWLFSMVGAFLVGRHNFFVPRQLRNRRKLRLLQIDNNNLQIVVWESIFFNQAVSSVKITRLWAVLINRWILISCDFSVFWKPLISWFSAAVTVQSRRRNIAIALPLHRNANDFWPKTGFRSWRGAPPSRFSALNAPVPKC